MLDIDTLLRSKQLFDGHYKLLRPLSTDGATADVWLALDTNTIDIDADETDESSGMLVAIKIYRPKNALDIEGEQRFRDEYKIAHECRHTNLLPPEGFSIFEEVIEMHFLQDDGSDFSFSPLAAFIEELFEALCDSLLSHLSCVSPVIVILV